MQRGIARIAEAVPLPCGHDHGLAGVQRGAFLSEPYIGLWASTVRISSILCKWVGAHHRWKTRRLAAPVSAGMRIRVSTPGRQ
jgi:hypothetical protein